MDWHQAQVPFLFLSLKCFYLYIMEGIKGIEWSEETIQIHMHMHAYESTCLKLLV